VLRSLAKHRSALTTVAEIVGFAAVVFGVFRISLTAGFIAAGAALVLIGVLEG
jgi:hypothetical protein